MTNPHAHEVRSKFKEGLNTFEIAKHFGIEEYEAVELLDQARKDGFKISSPSQKSMRRGSFRGPRAAAIAKRNVQVSLAPVKFLETK